jgi:hypothetical protein
MGFFKRLIDFVTQGSERPMRRLVAYYIVLALLTTALAYAFPVVDRMFSGDRLESLADTPQLLQNGLVTGQSAGPALNVTPIPAPTASPARGAYSAGSTRTPWTRSVRSSTCSPASCCSGFPSNTEQGAVKLKTRRSAARGVSCCWLLAVSGEPPQVSCLRQATKSAGPGAPQSRRAAVCNEAVSVFTKSPTLRFAT